MNMGIYFPNLGIDLKNVPKILELYGIQISYFGILIAFGMLWAAYHIVMAAKRSGQDPNDYLKIIIWGSIGALIGARILYMAFFWEEVKKDASLLWKVYDGGFAIYGGILGGFLVSAIYCKAKKISLGKMLDILCGGILIVQIIGNIGLFFNREGFGDYTNSLFAMQIPVSFVKDAELTEVMQKNLVLIDKTKFVQVHPTFLYECIWCLLLLLFIGWYRRRRRFDGEIFTVYLLGYSMQWVCLSKFRMDCLFIPKIKIPAFQAVGVGLSILCLIYIFVGRMLAKKRKDKHRELQEAKYLAEERMILSASDREKILQEEKLEEQLGYKDINEEEFEQKMES